VILLNDNEATRTTFVRTSQHCMRTKMRPWPDATRLRPKILA